MGLARTLAAVSVLLSLACESPTQLTVVVDSDVAGISGVRAVVSTAAGGLDEQLEEELELPDELPVGVVGPDGPQRIEVTLDLRPPTATLHLDGELVEGPLTLPDDATLHELSVRAPGYRPLTRNVRGDRDRDLTIRLRRQVRRPGLPAEFREW